MTGSQLVNGLAGLLIITSFLVMSAKKPAASAVHYAIQSIVLVLIFVALAEIKHSPELTVWAVTATITKVVLVPLIMYRVLRNLKDPDADQPVIGMALTILASCALLALSYFVVMNVKLPVVAHLKPALAVSMGHFFIGLLCIVTHNNILKQIFGYCLMENGSHLSLALLASEAPEVVEIGIATDAVFAVIVMVVLARIIHRRLNTLDARKLMSLKG